MMQYTALALETQTMSIEHEGETTTTCMKKDYDGGMRFMECPSSMCIAK
jgi:hypothetical protein